MSLWPKEHGAYGQLVMPLVTSFAVSGASRPAVLLAMAVVAAFLAHEPLLVLLGRRGGRAAREWRGRAILWLAVTGSVAIAAALSAVALMPDAARRALAWPMAPALVVGVAIATGREKRAMGETSVALVFSLVALPLGLAAGAARETALSVALVFGVVFVACTLAVRSLVLSTRGGGQPVASRRMRDAALVFSGVAATALALAASRAVVSWAAVVAAAPGLLAACWLTLRPPPPTELRRVGWTLVAVSAAAALMLMAQRVVD